MSRAYKFHNPDGLYFVSFATVEWVDVFTRREYKDLLIENLRFCQQEKGLELFAWCIMTNHVHLIGRAQEGHLFQDILRDYKKFTSKRLVEMITDHPAESKKEWMLRKFSVAGRYNHNNKYFQFWQQDNRPIELFSTHVTQQKLDYLHNNPVVAGFVHEPHHYIYSSAIDYSGGKGLLPISFIG